jgi:hypothetical protein
MDNDSKAGRCKASRLKCMLSAGESDDKIGVEDLRLGSHPSCRERSVKESGTPESSSQPVREDHGQVRRHDTIAADESCK